jgi:hypothetical protein
MKAKSLLTRIMAILEIQKKTNNPKIWAHFYSKDCLYNNKSIYYEHLKN